MGNFNPVKPTKYLGTNKYITFFVSRNRQPTSADYRQPETGSLYSVGTVWQVAKDPTTGVEGELWMLSKIVSNQGFWVQISGTTPLLDSIQVDTFTAPGTNPVVPNGSGLITVTGAQIANADLANVIRTDSLAVNTYTIEIQQASGAASTNSVKNGVCHFNTTHFVIGANAFISAQVASTSQIGIVTLATQAQHEYNTYGTTQVLQSQYIPAMMAKPSAIGSTTPNTGAFTSLSSNAGQTFSNALNTFPCGSMTVLTNAFSSLNKGFDVAITATVPGSIVSGFGTGVEIKGQDTGGAALNYAAFYGVIEDVTLNAEISYGTVFVLGAGSTLESVRFYSDRVQTANTTSRFRLGSGGVDFLSGSGDPNGAVTAAKGSLYMRTDGSSTSTRAYVNTDGATAWTSVTTAT